MVFYGYRIDGRGKLFNYYLWATLNNNIQCNFKKFSLFFRQTEMVSAIVWFLDHFTLEYVPSVNYVWIIAFVSHSHVWVTKFKPLFMIFKMPILTSNNVVWMPFSSILFDETQHVVKTSATGYIPVSYKIINLCIKLQNFLLMPLTSKLKGFYLIDTVCDGLPMFFFDLFNSCIKSTRYDVFQDVLPFILLILGPRQPGVTRQVGTSSCLVRISHLSRPFNDVRISSIPKNFPTRARLNQFCSSLSTNTSTSLRLNSSNFLPVSLETFNKEEIFIKFQTPARSPLVPGRVSIDNGCVNIFTFCSKLSQQCINDFTIMV